MSYGPEWFVLFLGSGTTLGCIARHCATGDTQFLGLAGMGAAIALTALDHLTRRWDTSAQLRELTGGSNV